MNSSPTLICYDGSTPAWRAIRVPGGMLAVSAPTGIVDVADKTGASAIVIGSHGRTGVRKFVDGSVSHEIATHSVPPDLVLTPQTRCER